MTSHPLLVPWSWKSRAIPLLPLWALRPVQSLSACTRVHFTFTILSVFYVIFFQRVYEQWIPPEIFFFLPRYQLSQPITYFTNPKMITSDLGDIPASWSCNNRSYFLTSSLLHDVFKSVYFTLLTRSKATQFAWNIFQVNIRLPSPQCV